MILDLRRRYGAKISKLCILTFLGPWSSFQSMQDLDVPSTYESIHSISWPLVTIQCQYLISRDVIWCHDFGSTAPLRRQTLESSYLDFLRSSMVVPTHVGTRYTLSGSIYLFSWPLHSDNPALVWHLPPRNMRTCVWAYGALSPYGAKISKFCSLASCGHIVPIYYYYY